ncbi:glycoside hydrolase [Coprinopsis sp. MPI-PUGE-AT-0042]|nr:glycoside hydrolase [Coprinopsis sp. MPI-PUGE-AT-0042]
MSGLPAGNVMAVTGETHPGTGVLAEIASCQLEFKYLVKETGRAEYYERAEGVMQTLYNSSERYQGLLLEHWDISEFLQAGDRQALDMYLETMKSIINNLLYVSPNRGLLYVTDLQVKYPYTPAGAEDDIINPNGSTKTNADGSPRTKSPPTPNIRPSHKLEHLSCFLPGLLALGVHQIPLHTFEALPVAPPDPGGLKLGLHTKPEANDGKRPWLTPWELEHKFAKEERERHWLAAEGLAYTCWVLYADQATGMGPDEVWFGMPPKLCLATVATDRQSAEAYWPDRPPSQTWALAAIDRRHTFSASPDLVDLHRSRILLRRVVAEPQRLLEASSLNFGALFFVLLRSRRYSGCESTIKGTSRFSERSPGTAVSTGGTSDTPEKWVDVMKRWGRAGSAAAIDEKAGGVKSSEVDASEGEGIKLRQISNNGDENDIPKALESLYILWKTSKNPIRHKRGWKAWAFVLVLVWSLSLASCIMDVQVLQELLAALVVKSEQLAFPGFGCVLEWFRLGPYSRACRTSNITRSESGARYQRIQPADNEVAFPERSMNKCRPLAQKPADGKT